jgi:hypothetical protein
MKPVDSVQQDRLRVIALVMMAVAGRVALLLGTSHTSDDAFIMYRYAENLAHGNGFVFNAGEHVQGVSGPLYTLILSALASLFGTVTIPLLSKVLSVLADAITLALLLRSMEGLQPAGMYASAVLFALYPKVVMIGISGMESSLVLMFIVLSYYSLTHERTPFAMFMLGLLLLARPDNVLWLLALGGVLWQRGQKVSWTDMALVVLPPLAWYMFAALYFGNPVPHAIVAKRVSWQHMFPVFDPLRVLLGYFPFQGLHNTAPLARVLLVVVFLLPVVGTLRIVMRRRSPLVVFPLYFVVHALAFSFARVLMADWYYLSGYLAYFICVGVVLDWILERWAIKVRSSSFNIALSVVLTSLLLIGGIRWSENPAGIFLRQNYAVGVWLRSHASSQSSVMLEPIGYVGWYSTLKIHDYIGLVSPEVVAYRRKFPNSDAWFMHYVQDKVPDYLVLRNWEVPTNRLFHGHGDGLFQSAQDRSWFEDHYMLVNWNPTASETDSVYLVLYKYTQGS